MESRSGQVAYPSSQSAYGSRLSPGTGFYRVRRGDTLYAIAWRANRDFREIARWNGIQPPYVIYAGQRIRLTPPVSKVTRSPSPKTSTRSSRTQPSKPKAIERPSRKATATKRDTAVAQKPSRLAWRWPVQGRVVARFKSGDPLNKGIKIAASEGSEIRAAEGGKVVYSGSGLIGYGQLIIIKHNEKYLSAYGHNRKLLVEQNQRVTKGQKIAEMGRSNDGRPLLHFELRQYGKPIDPLAFLPRR